MNAATSRSPAGYSPAQKALHWGMALLILGLIVAGLVMTNLGPGEAKNQIYELHKSFGLIVLTLALLRLALRRLHGAPPLEPDLPRWQKAVAHVSHVALYALFIAVPLLGWAGTSACCAPVRLFQAVPLTLPVSGGMETGKVILAVHGVAALTLAGLVAVHIGAALYHHLIRRDGTLRRMLPGRRHAEHGGGAYLAK